jgi:deferrochelatase/peroxidase EfeB
VNIGQSADTEPAAADPSPAPDRGFTRRGLLGGLVAGAGATALTAGVLSATAPRAGSEGAAGVAWRGEHQAGITTPAQDHLYFAAFDLTERATRDDVIRLMTEWTAAIERLVRGVDLGDGAVDGPALLPPDDTGEAHGLPPSGLTVTVGFGPGLFTPSGTDRLGLASRRPEGLEPLPLFPFDLLDESLSAGDLCLQACANDPQVAVHAIRNLARIGFGTVRLRWSQLGFGRTSSTTRAQSTPRNLFGFKDGTASIRAEDADALADYVWVGEDEPQEWLRGGSYLVCRRIEMTIENWDRVGLGAQEDIIGRTKGEGAPLSGGTEYTEADFTTRRTDGGPAIPETAHLRLAHPVTTGTRLLRRGYNFVDGDNGIGQIRGGLFFISFQRSPQQFVTVQSALATDALNEYIRHVGSALFAVPPGVTAPGDYLGRALLEA